MVVTSFRCYCRSFWW